MQQTENIKPGKRRFTFFRCVLILIVLLSILLYFYGIFLLKAYGNFLNVGKPLAAPVDAVYVLGGDITTRPFVAVEIFRAEYANELLYCGLADLKDQSRMANVSEENLIIKILQHSGLSNIPCINIGENVNSTIDEAKALLVYLEQHPDKTVAVVTNNYHTRRARNIILHHCSKYKDNLFFVAAPTDFYSPVSWWKSSEGRLYYSMEAIKLFTTNIPGGMD